MEPGKSLALKGVSKTDDNAVAEVIPFKDGRPIIKLSRNNNFAMKEIICSRSHETNVEADEFIIYVYEGEIKITAKWIDMLEKTVSAGEKIELPLPTWDKIETRSVNLFDGESVAVISYYENGKELSEDVMGPVKWRTITLKERGDVKAVTLSQKGDKIVFSVKKGKMLIKLGQFDSFKF